VDPETPFDGGFSVHSIAAQQVAIKRGFREVNVLHLSAVIKQILHHAKKATTIRIINLHPQYQVLYACRKAPYRTCSGTVRSLMLSHSFKHLKTIFLTPRWRFPTIHADFGHQRCGRQLDIRALVALAPCTLGAMLVTMPCVLNKTYSFDLLTVAL
jgi:hypothetical protein